MIAVTFAEQVGEVVPRLRTDGERYALPASPRYKVLLAEHRDEVFARLAADLTELGHTVFRVTRSDELPQLYGYVAPQLVLCSHELSGGSGWIAATRLQMYHAAARVWLYTPWVSDFDPTWTNISCVESVIYYRGDLWRLADAVVARLRHFRLTARGRSCDPGRRRTGRAPGPSAA
jgi:hypothetical protein